MIATNAQLEVSPASNLDARLRRAWARERRVAHVIGLSAATATGAVLFLLLLALDRWLLFSPPARLVLFASAGLVFLYVLYRQWWRRLERFDPARIALRVERQHPYLRSLVVSYAQLRAAHDQDPTTTRMIDAMRDQAAQAAAPIDFTRIVDWRPARRWLGLALLGIAAMAAVTLWSPAMVRRFVSRAISPRSTQGYPTRTRVLHVAYPRVVRPGEPVVITALADGELPHEGRIHIRPTRGRREVLAMVREGEPRKLNWGPVGHPYVYRAAAVAGDFEFFVRIGDAQSETYRVALAPQPRLIDSRVTIAYPRYTGVEGANVQSLSFAAVTGSVAQWTLRFDRPVAGVELVLDSGQVLRASIDSSHRVAQLSRPLTESFSYQLRYRDRSHPHVYEQGVHHFVQVTPDAPPEVELLDPAEDLIATLRRQFTLRYRASDDFGLSRVTLVYDVNDGPEQRFELDAPQGRRIEVGLPWSPARELGLRDGDVLEFAIEVTDTEPGALGGNTARTVSRRMTFLSDAAYLRHVLEAQEAKLRELDQVRTQAQESRRRLEELKRAVSPANAAPGEQVKPDRGVE